MDSLPSVLLLLCAAGNAHEGIGAFVDDKAGCIFAEGCMGCMLLDPVEEKAATSNLAGAIGRAPKVVRLFDGDIIAGEARTVLCGCMDAIAGDAGRLGVENCTQIEQLNGKQKQHLELAYPGSRSLIWSQGARKHV